MLRSAIRTNGFDLEILVSNTNQKAASPARASELTLLQEAKLQTRRKRIKSDTLTPDQRADCQRIIGIDFGEKYAAGVVCKKLASYGNDGEGNLTYDPKEDAEGHIRFLTIKTAALSQPTREFLHWSSHAKTEELRVMELKLAREEEESVLDWFPRWIANYLALCTFYNSRGYKKRQFELARAQRRELDLAVTGILAMAGRRRNDKSDFRSDGTVVFSVGDCEIGTPGSIGYYSTFTRYLVKRVRELGYPVVLHSEHNTSQCFPIAGYRTVPSGADKIRIKYCAELDMHIHRDVMGGENMADVQAAELRNLGRPQHLMTRKQREALSSKAFSQDASK